MDDQSSEELGQGDELHYETLDYQNRGFHRLALENSTYFAPVDENERERLQDQHAVLYYLLNQQLIIPMVTPLQKILDCGFGEGSWAWGVAEQHPSCEVTAVDVSPVMISSIAASAPPNLSYEVFDLNDRFTTFESNHFDLVNSRLVAGGINTERWSSYLRDILRVLRPGGWCQMIEVYFNAQSDNGTLTEGHALREWSNWYLEAMAQTKNPRIPFQMKGLMDAAGFRDVVCDKLQLPMCGWSNGSHPNMFEIGTENYRNVSQLLESLAIYPAMEILGKSATEFQLLVAQARHEAADPALRPYFAVYVLRGRKPRR